jgi:hypothetical protein
MARVTQNCDSPSAQWPCSVLLSIQLLGQNSDLWARFFALSALVTSSLLLASRFATVRGAGYRVASNTGLQKASFLLNSGVFYSIEVVSRQETANQ